MCLFSYKLDNTIIICKLHLTFQKYSDFNIDLNNSISLQQALASNPSTVQLITGQPITRPSSVSCPSSVSSLSSAVEEVERDNVPRRPTPSSLESPRVLEQVRTMSICYSIPITQLLLSYNLHVINIIPFRQTYYYHCSNALAIIVQTILLVA